MTKGPDAFRTISEVAEELNIPQHVLRFWETRFAQIRPVKRGGGRRFYRPEDVALLRGIRHLLYGAGYTIRGVQRILREQGVAHVQGLVAQAQGSSRLVSDALAATPAGHAAGSHLTGEGFTADGHDPGAPSFTGGEDDADAQAWRPADDPDDQVDAAGDIVDDDPPAPTDDADFAGHAARIPEADEAEFNAGASAQIDAVIDRYAPGPLSLRARRNNPQGSPAVINRMIEPSYQLAGSTREQLQAVVDELRECRRLLASALNRQSE
ncbi:DNA-binding transcriptional MerR regulator [Pseudochelatococcus lubricantis]|uniref:DNA-binding transcriptional MerR regulator n=1 Tax=Pseudochelatococcus lubricantis TaxID=1538102 RepID=A0ABX0UXC7_9HYPH|nr:DNA-binding transcriptional MerR regulator [Pseudochelatococcus lubricantis]